MDLLAVMVDRFLGYHFPEDMCPDGGLSFKRPDPAFNPHWTFERDGPIGTNLLTAVQAQAMFAHCAGPLIAKLEMDREAAMGCIHDEIAANTALREKGGALPDEDMPTFCDRLIAERATMRAALERVVKDWVHPYDEGEFEDGEMPAMDMARAALAACGATP